eukprot:6555061-Prymnesium_polylepis.1
MTTRGEPRTSGAASVGRKKGGLAAAGASSVTAQLVNSKGRYAPHYAPPHWGRPRDSFAKLCRWLWKAEMLRHDLRFVPTFQIKL